VLDIASGPDLLRLLAVPFFGYVAWLDIRTRRVSNRTWLPLVALAVALLVWDLLRVTTGDVDPVVRQNFLVRTAISIGFVVPLAYLFWRIGGFGGADAKAFFVVALLFPVFPSYELWRWSLGPETLGWLFDPLPGATYRGTLPMVQTTVGVFSITILSNTVVMGALYPVGLAARNAAVGYFSPGMFVAKPVRWDAVTDEYGTLLRLSDRSMRESLSVSGLGAYFSFRGLDLDALRMYLRWRDVSLVQLREHPERYRHPASLPAEPGHPGDGSIPVDGWESTAGDDPDASEISTPGEMPVEESSIEDPWGAEAFLADIEGSAYGTSPEALREALDALVAEDVVWISPGIPFLVPLFVGLVLAFVYGDVLFALFEALGLAA